MAAHEVLQLYLDLPLGHAGAHERDDMRERGIGDGLGGAQARDLGRLLDGAQVEDEAARLVQAWYLGGCLDERGLEGAELAEREGVLDAEHEGGGRRVALGVRGVAAIAEGVGDELRVGLPRIVDGDGTVRGGDAGRVGIARVGMEHRGARRDEQRMGTFVVEHAVEGGEPGDVRGVAHKECVDAGVGAGGAQAVQTASRSAGLGAGGAIGRAAHRRPPCSPPCPCP